MTKRNKIIYWISTAWLSLGMLSTGIVQLFNVKGEVEFILDLGYPPALLPLLGIWKILGVVAVLIPKFPLLKEIFPPFLLLVLTVVSWYSRPAGRKIIPVRLK